MAPDDAVLVRMSRAQKAQLKEEAAHAGLTLRALALHRLLGLDVSTLPTGPGPVPRRRRPQEELPMTG